MAVTPYWPQEMKFSPPKPPSTPREMFPIVFVDCNGERYNAEWIGSGRLKCSAEIPQRFNGIDSIQICHGLIYHAGVWAKTCPECGGDVIGGPEVKKVKFKRGPKQPDEEIPF